MSPHLARILIVEDDPRIREELVDLFRAAGMDMEIAVNYRQALEEIRREHDLILLDLGLPDGDGLDLCRLLRRNGRSVPIIMLTAREDPDQRVRGLNVGADDYVVKPFHPPELLARVQSVLRRAGTLSGSGRLTHRDLWVEPEGHRAGRGDETLELKPREFALLAFLLRNPGRPWTREQLIDRVWGAEFDGDHRTVDLHVHRLRAKIEEDPGNPQLLETVWGVGYRMKEAR